jgi:hypothetical protein
MPVPPPVMRTVFPPISKLGAAPIKQHESVGSVTYT